MEDRKTDLAVLFLQFIPVFIAISGLTTKFNVLDFTYLMLVFIIFAKYIVKIKK